jgi:hypothetical protein
MTGGKMLRDFLLCWYLGQSYPRRPQAKVIEYFIGILPSSFDLALINFDERQESIMACAYRSRLAGRDATVQEYPSLAYII